MQESGVWHAPQCLKEGKRVVTQDCSLLDTTTVLNDLWITQWLALVSIFAYESVRRWSSLGCLSCYETAATNFNWWCDVGSQRERGDGSSLRVSYYVVVIYFTAPQRF